MKRGLLAVVLLLGACNRGNREGNPPVQAAVEVPKPAAGALAVMKRTFIVTFWHDIIGPEDPGELAREIASPRFRLNRKIESGTAFSVDVDGRQYVITAKHITPMRSDGDVPLGSSHAVFLGSNIPPLHPPVVATLVGYTKAPADTMAAADIAVFALPYRLSWEETPTLSDKINVTDNVYLLGYPRSGAELMGTPESDGGSLPLIKHAMISGVSPEGRGFYLDGLSTFGCSGGPIVASGSPPTVIGVWTGFLSLGEIDGGETDGGERERLAGNIGISFATNIKYARDMINANPIGFPLGGN
jgi:hypothetical protein